MGGGGRDGGRREVGGEGPPHQGTLPDSLQRTPPKDIPEGPPKGCRGIPPGDPPTGCSQGVPSFLGGDITGLPGVFGGVASWRDPSGRSPRGSPWEDPSGDPPGRLPGGLPMETPPGDPIRGPRLITSCLIISCLMTSCLVTSCLVM